MVNDDWWYLNNDYKHGPLSKEEIEKRLLAGEITVDTRVWNEGLADWTQLSLVSALNDISRSYQNTTDTQINTSITHKLTAGPWSRLIARYIDVIIYFSLVTTITVSVKPEFIDYHMDSDDLFNIFIIIPITFLVLLMIDVPLNAAFNNTPGKWIFGIKVHRQDGQNLSAWDILKRNMGVWIYGFGLSMPIVSIVTHIMNYIKLRNGTLCKWDEVGKYKVRQKHISKFRFSIGVIVALSPLILAISIFISFVIIADNAHKKLIDDYNKINIKISNLTGKVMWINPLTGISTNLNNNWNEITDEQTQAGTYVFYNSKLDSSVIIGREKYHDGDIVDYVDSLIKNGLFGELEHKAIVLNTEGENRFSLTYRLKEADVKYRAEIKVWQGGPGEYWRSVALFPYNDAGARADAMIAAISLETTAY